MTNMVSLTRGGGVKCASSTGGVYQRQRGGEARRWFRDWVESHDEPAEKKNNGHPPKIYTNEKMGWDKMKQNMTLDQANKRRKCNDLWLIGTQI